MTEEEFLRRAPAVTNDFTNDFTYFPLLTTFRGGGVVAKDPLAYMAMTRATLPSLLEWLNRGSNTLILTPSSTGPLVTRRKKERKIVIE